MGTMRVPPRSSRLPPIWSEHWISAWPSITARCRRGCKTEVGTLRARLLARSEDKSWGVYVFQGASEAFTAGRHSEERHARRPLHDGRLLEGICSVWPAVRVRVGCCRGRDHLPPDHSSEVIRRDRRAEQRAFMRSQKRIMVATKSFGMGIDKEDIRLVIHHSPPGDLLSYAQEVGRAARDRKLGRVILYYTEARIRADGYSLTDRGIQERFLEGRYVRECDLPPASHFWASVRGGCKYPIERGV